MATDLAKLSPEQKDALIRDLQRQVASGQSELRLLKTGPAVFAAESRSRIIVEAAALSAISTAGARLKLTTMPVIAASGCFSSALLKAWSSLNCTAPCSVMAWA